MKKTSVFKNAKLLIIDDRQVNLILLERILAELGFENIHIANSAKQALEKLDNSFDLIITDQHMPKMTGLELVAAVRLKLGEGLAILLSSSELDFDLERAALDAGVTDFLPKPYSLHQVLTRVRGVLQTKFLQLELSEQSVHFETEIRKRTKALQQAHLEALERLALAAEYRDYMTGRHTSRVGMLSARIALELGLPEQEIDLIRRAAPLHDVGKIGIPDRILLKPGKLTSQEFEVMKTHVQLGIKLLSPNNSRLVRMAKLIALTHHERWDGQGYPKGLQGQDIPLVGQIVAVADVYDALVSKRPYKHAWKAQEAIDEIQVSKGSAFAPKVVDAFMGVVDSSLKPSLPVNAIQS